MGEKAFQGIRQPEYEWMRAARNLGERKQRLGKLLANSAPGIQLTPHHEDVFASRDVDAVLIAVPDHLHVSLGQPCLQARKHLSIEKPTVHRWSEGVPLQAAAEQVLQCGTQQRSGPHYIRASEPPPANLD